MLVLSRKPGEVLIVTLPDGREVRVVVTQIHRSHVSIGIEAPREILVRRGELREKPRAA